MVSKSPDSSILEKSTEANEQNKAPEFRTPTFEAVNLSAFGQTSGTGGTGGSGTGGTESTLTSDTNIVPP